MVGFGRTLFSGDALEDGVSNLLVLSYIGAGIAPSNDLEAAILATLPPGSYTAVASGLGNTTGIGLIEIYNLR